MGSLRTLFSGLIHLVKISIFIHKRDFYDSNLRKMLKMILTTDFKFVELDQCEEYPCHNNGVCNNTREGMGFTCICVDHYGGKQCDTGI